MTFKDKISKGFKKIDKTALSLGIITIIVSVFAIILSEDNVWNTPKFDVQLSKNPTSTSPLDDIVKTIYQDNHVDLTADWIKNRDVDSLRDDVKSNFSPDDAWILERIYYEPTNGTSQKITIKNTGNAQAHDIIIQILGTNNFKIIDYTCPEIISTDQISKEHGKKYLIVESRMSVQLECVITINSVGPIGVEKVIVTASDAQPAVWPDDEINKLIDTNIYLNVLLYISVIVLVFTISYNATSYFRKNPKSLS